MRDAEQLFIEHKTLFEDAVKRRVCEICEDYGADDRCHTRDSHGCAIDRFLPQIVAIAIDVHDKGLGAYIEAVRKRVCAVCDNPDPMGRCEVRERVDCALDRYLPLVLEAVEEVLGELRRLGRI